MGDCVSVVVPVYNGERWIDTAIHSVLSQTYPSVQLIIVDDGSTDKTTDIVRSLASKAIVIRQRNLGVSHARNAGIRECTGEYIAFLDADDSWMPTKLERQVECFEASPEAGLVHTGAFEIDDRGVTLRTVLDGAHGRTALDLFLYRTAIVGGGSSAMVRTALCETVGGFSPDLSTTADWDFYLRIAELSDVAFIPEPLVRYSFHAENMHSDIDLASRDMLNALRAASARRPCLYKPHIRRAHGRVHRILSGSSLHQGQLRKAVRHGVQSLVCYPEGVGSLASGVLRGGLDLIKPTRAQ